jgi:uncharacterized membrane protein YccC
VVLQRLLHWPPGTTMFVFKTWLALAIGFYAAFLFQLEGAASCGICVLIVAQPNQGMVLSKAIYRTGGTLIGVVVGIAISAIFVQDRTMLIASFAIWLGICTAAATILRDFRAYGCVLAGYTVAIISITNIDTPNAAFNAAIDRVAAILVGIAAITLANMFLAGSAASQSLIRKLRCATTDVVKMARGAIENRSRLDPELCVNTAAWLMALRSEITFATPEQQNGRARAAGARSALLGLFESISAIEAVGYGLSQIENDSPLIIEAIALTQKAIGHQKPEKFIAAFDDMTLTAVKSGTIQIAEAHLLDRLRFLITTLSNVRNGLRALRFGFLPSRRAALPVHHDYVAVVLNATRIIVAIAIVAVLSIWSGIPYTALAIVLTSVFVSLGSLLPNPGVMGNAGLFGMPIAVVLSVIYSFFIFPNIEGYPLFILSLAPLVALMCWLTMIGQPGYGLIAAVITLTQVAPANVQKIDPESFTASATMLIPAGLAIFMAFRLILPVQPQQRRLRIALAIGQALRNALADRGQQGQPRASLHFDRLSQFKIWQGGEKVTLARRKTMQRLIDLGLLSYAVRRSWRALDAARRSVPAQLDQSARQILPTLSPDETEDVALQYLAHAQREEGEAALALLHAAAALHGTAAVTHREELLLRRIELFHHVI